MNDGLATERCRRRTRSQFLPRSTGAHRVTAILGENIRSDGQHCLAAGRARVTLKTLAMHLVNQLCGPESVNQMHDVNALCLADHTHAVSEAREHAIRHRSGVDKRYTSHGVFISHMFTGKRVVFEALLRSHLTSGIVNLDSTRCYLIIAALRDRVKVFYGISSFSVHRTRWHRISFNLC